ncbi:MAG: triose-phosphate isomerase [Erysipelotrichaceae bacterium]|nr:triose-phosphate isomerase [Erysipelotrichaceae bacterium]
MRKKVIVGNWKMNHCRNEASEFVSGIKDEVKIAKSHNILIGIAPTYMSLDVVSKKKPAGLILSAQNVNEHASGAYTGEVSISMLSEVKGLTHIIIGHSERRQYYGETNERCNAKMLAMQEANLTPIYCVGETLEQFEANLTKKVIKEQVVTGLANLSAEFVSKMIIAYEPVWSIGTGKNASKEIAQDICCFIRKEISKLYGKRVANKVIIQYGGSVKPNNVKDYLTQPDIDGALVGGASLKASTFIELISNLY